MLIQSSLPGSLEGPLSLVSDHGKGDRLPVAETWQKCSMLEKNSSDQCEEVVPTIEGKRNIDHPCSLNFANSCSQISTVSTMSENFTPAFVYRRRKPQRNSLSVSPAQASAKPSGDCLSAISSEAPSVAGKRGHRVSVVELESEVGTPVLPTVECSREALILNSESINGCLDGEEPDPKEAPKSDPHRVLDFCCINDSYSSSKSNVEPGLASLRTEVDDTGECSSSGALVVESVQDYLSEKDICIAILRRQWLREGVLPIRIHTFTEGTGICSDSSCIRTCKVCDNPETTLKMLICDQCEEAFHLSCCNPRIKKIPVNEWFCHSCLKKKHKILKESSTSKARNTSSEANRCKSATSEGELGPIASMLMDNEPYKTGVRIGQDFQAEVPDWSGPTFEEVGEPLEINSSESIGLHGWNSSKPSRLSPIGNWLQCREVLEGTGEGIDGTICGKWRRAPLFEVQTDDWECFSAVLWDPAHADCAVPQELDTDQVLKQLKYIEMLRPRLATKRRKLDLPRNGGSQDVAEELHI